MALGARWERFMSVCRDSQQTNSLTQSVNSQSCLIEVDECRTDTMMRGQRRPPELNLISKAKRGRIGASSPRVGGRKEIDLSSSSASAFQRQSVASTTLTIEDESTVSWTNQPSPAITSQITSKQNLQTDRSPTLPIKRWVSGTNIIESSSSEISEPQYWFRVQGSNVSILNGSPTLGTLLFEFELGRDIISVEVISLCHISCVKSDVHLNIHQLPQTHSVAGGFPLIVLTLCQTDRTALFIKKNKTLGAVIYTTEHNHKINLVEWLCRP